VARWTDLQKIESWAGETRVNLIRFAAIAAFYAQHLLRVYVLDPDDASLRGAFHASATALAIAWSASAVALHFALSRRWNPPALKYGSSMWDLLMVSSLVILAGGPRTPLILLYPVVVCASALRLSLRLVWVTTMAALAAWIFVLGWSKFYAPSMQTDRGTQIIMALAIGATGLLAGQMVRQARRLVRGYPVNVEDEP
jgi:hypothetical protein